MIFALSDETLSSIKEWTDELLKGNYQHLSNWENSLNFYLPRNALLKDFISKIAEETLEQANEKTITVECKSNLHVFLGLIHQINKYKYKDYQNSVKFFEKAIALNNNSQAMQGLAQMYMKGQGVQDGAVNYEMAIKFYEQAINLNNSSAMFYRGLMHDLGHGCEVDPEKAIEL